ncbi:MAG: hypothetical protein C0487_08725 [Leptothrix sp. (in: Bacteria)]|nr:hypothetical protein [Leptothrix sp. (in: b-proteobacteria)]
MNHYDCLKVTSDAPTEVIRAAYRALAGKRHPDRQGGTMGRDDEMHDQMVAINAAYEVLVSPELRAEYDAMLAAQARPVDTNPRFNTDVAEGNNTGFSDTRVDIDWATPKTAGPAPLWPLTANRKYAAMILGGVLLLSFIWVAWSVVVQHQMDKALSDQYAALPPERGANEDPLGLGASATTAPTLALARPQSAGASTGAETPDDLQAAEQDASPSSAPRPPPSFDRQPTVTELSKLSDEQLMAILPSLGELQPAKGSFSRQVASSSQHHPLDGKPLNLRQERQLVDPLTMDALHKH